MRGACRSTRRAAPGSATSAWRRSPISPWSSRRWRSSRRTAPRDFAVLERTIAALRASGVLVLADAKRGDIGSTMAAYADAWAGDSPLAADAVTASPYLGFGSLQPLLDTAAAHGRGVFVLAATSNPEGAQRPAGRYRRAARSRSRSSMPPPRSTRGRPSPVRSASSSARRCPTRPTSAPWAVRSWCPASARRAGAPRRCAGLAGPGPGSCCPRCHARCCGPDPTSPPCARPPSDPRRGRLSGMTVPSDSVSGIQLPPNQNPASRAGTGVTWRPPWVADAVPSPTPTKPASPCPLRESMHISPL